MAGDPSDLAAALEQFDRVVANVAKLESIWAEVGAAHGQELEKLIRQFAEFADALPSIDGFSVDARPLDDEAVTQLQIDVWELGGFETRGAVERATTEPGRQLSEYRFRLDKARRRLVRDQVLAVTQAIDSIVVEISYADGVGAWRFDDRWDDLREHVSTLERLAGSQVPGHARWSDLHRHLHFAASNDLSDIASMDWPSVRAEVVANLFDDSEPLPVTVDDLGELVRARPTGPVSSQLDWSRIDEREFERLIYNLFQRSDGYENVNWLMHTNAPDRGRDIEAYRVVEDSLAGVSRSRLIIQCKHWTSKSVGRRELIDCVESVKLWEPPTVDVLIIATTGRFSQDAVAVAERRLAERAVPRVDLWADSHLETLLARRPDLVANSGLRG